MKTSNKLLILLLIAIPISLWTYNLCMKQAYLQGNFYIENLSIDTVYQDLPSFNHITIDGRLHYKNGWMGSSSFNVRIITSNNEKLNLYQLYKPSHLDDVLQAKVENDTLFLSLCKENVNQNYFWGSLIVKVPQLNSAKFNYGTFSLENLYSKAFSLSVSNGTVDIKKSIISHTNLLSDSSTVNIKGSNLLDTVLYTAGTKTHLWLDKGNIKHLKTDTSREENAKITISGETDDMLSFFEANYSQK